MPSLGADLEAGTLTRWLVKPGDAVKRGQVVVLVETDKGIVEVEIWQPGVVEQLVVAPGTKVPVGTVLATLHEAGEPRAAVSAGAPNAPVTAPPIEAPAIEAPPAPVVAPKAPAATPRPLASPAARKRARELDIDVAAVAGTGPHGAVSVADVEQAANAKAASAGGAREADEKEIDRTLAMRRAIGAAMARSKREIPHYYVATDIDTSRAQAWLTAENLRRPVSERLLLAVLELKAVALALREVPELNGFWADGAPRPADAVHLGVAISLRKGGLVAPAIHDVDRKTLGEIMTDLTDLTRRARAGTLRSSEMTDPTITVTSLGEQGVEIVYGVIYPPQVALVGLGKVTERPWAAGGMLGVRPVLTATLSADHRASDGHRGALFLAAVSRFLQAPEKL
jgi:pyruvate dehydrogenase E2 component (dihydrolipoamide acetyltransferase)